MSGEAERVLSFRPISGYRNSVAAYFDGQWSFSLQNFSDTDHTQAVAAMTENGGPTEVSFLDGFESR